MTISTALFVSCHCHITYQVYRYEHVFMQQFLTALQVLKKNTLQGFCGANESWTAQEKIKISQTSVPFKFYLWRRQGTLCLDVRKSRSPLLQNMPPSVSCFCVSESIGRTRSTVNDPMVGPDIQNW